MADMRGLGEWVRLTTSQEAGEIVGRAEYPHRPNQYLVRYRAADGRQVECWWDETAIVTARK